MHMRNFQSMPWCRSLALALLLLCFPLGSAFAQGAPTPGTDVTPPDVGSFEAAQDVSVSYDHLSLYVLPLNSDQLSDLATIWQGHLQDVLDEGITLRLEIEAVDGSEQARLQDQLIDVTLEQIDVQKKYGLVIDTWRGRGGDEKDLAPHEAFESALTAEILLAQEKQTLVQLFWTWLTTSRGLIDVLVTGIIYIAGLAFVSLLASLTSYLAAYGLERVSKLSRSQRKLFRSLIFWLFLALGVLVFLAFAGVNVTGLFALIGGVSLILGLALQETIGNLASGLMLIFLKPIDIGDYVIVGNIEGTAEDVGLFSTSVRTFDNSLVVIPNGKVWSDAIRNVEANKVRRVEFNFSTANLNEFADIKNALLKLAEDHPNCLSKPAPTIYISNLDEHVMTIIFWVWVKTADHWETYTDLSGQIQETFNAMTMREPVFKADVRILDAHEE